MPIYQYKCRNCGAKVEKMQSVTADPISECPECHQQTLKRVLQPVGIIFKGTGWYSTDSKGASSSVGASSRADGERESSKLSETAPKGEGQSKAPESASAPAEST